LFVNDRNLQLDYRNCEEDFLPFYPVMENARKVSGTREEIVCVPLNHFYGSRRAVTRQNISLAANRISKGTVRKPGEQRINAQESDGQSRLAFAFDKLIKPAMKRKHFVSDTGRLNYRLMQEMIGSIRQRAHDSGWSQVPVVLTNHPKDVRDWAGLERFVGEVSQAHDIKFITLTEMAGKLQSGEFEIRICGKL